MGHIILVLHNEKSREVPSYSSASCKGKFEGKRAPGLARTKKNILQSGWLANLIEPGLEKNINTTRYLLITVPDNEIIIARMIANFRSGQRHPKKKIQKKFYKLHNYVSTKLQIPITYIIYL
uniref:Uncharacterized protein n=1 Tax=Cacopsylla melanoneura TaxID=428564 RepID=A0A8D9E6P6_9HEMI